MVSGNLSSLEEALIEEEEFYKVALDPHLDQIDIGKNDILDQLLIDDSFINDLTKISRRPNPWRKNSYEPYHSLSVENEKNG